MRTVGMKKMNWIKAAAVTTCLSGLLFSACAAGSDGGKDNPKDFDLVKIEKPRILGKAGRYLLEAPRTVI